jgi:tetraacyldisaccharide 4'-kinase
MIKQFELYLKDIICGRQRGIRAAFIKVVLLIFSWFYQFAVYGRNWLYDRGWMRCYVPPVPLVISVGNIVAGGTGKTPVTLLLASALENRFKFAILSRGYRSKVATLETPIVLCEGHGPLFPASYCGDEPYLFAQRLPKAIIIVGSNRRKASMLAAKAGAQVILLDDGMQHRRLARDFDVVVVDAGDLFGQGYFLPRGFLRERVDSLKRADLIIVNHIPNAEKLSTIETQLRKFTSAPLVGTQNCVVAIRDLAGQVVETFADRSVGMFCAIARPEYFRQTIEQEGFQIVAEYILPDHASIYEKSLEQFSRLSSQKGAQGLICTEKDRVKLRNQLNVSLPIFWVQLELHIVTGHEEWKNFLQRAEAKIK